SGVPRRWSGAVALARPWSGRCDLGLLGGGLQGDALAEGFQLTDQVADLAAFVDAGGVVVGAEIGEAFGGIGEQVPDDGEDGSGDGDEGLELAAAFDDAPVAFTEERVGFGGRGGGLAEQAFQVGVALAGLAGPVFGAGLDGSGGEFGPGGQVPRGGEPGHVKADLGEDDLGAQGTDARDLVKTFDRGQSLGGCGVAVVGVVGVGVG